MVKALQAVTDPDALFERIGADPTFRWPLLFIVGGGVLGSVSQILVQQKLQSAMPSGAGIAQSLGVLISLVTSILQPVVVWIALAAAFYVISRRFDGDGKFRTTLTLVGWGFLPALVLALLTTVVMFVVVNGAPTPTGPQDVQSFFAAIRGNGYVTVAGYLPIAFAVWQGFVWTFAVRTARSLPLADAAKTVAGPAALLVAWTAYVEVVGVPTFVFGLPLIGIFLGGGGLV